jgi:hypothetical protein
LWNFRRNDEMAISVDQLSAYHDDELAPEERRTVEAHVAGCRECRSAIHAWSQASRALTVGAPSGPRLGRGRALVLASIAAFVLLGSGAAVASGLFNEVFHFGDVSAVASRRATLEAARVANLPLPRSDVLPGGWRLDQVQLVMTPTWNSVDVQYRRPGSRGMGIQVWSQGIDVNPTAQRREVLTVSGVPVEIGYSGDSATARFTHQGSTVIIRGSTKELDTDEISALVQAWIEQAVTGDGHGH